MEGLKLKYFVLNPTKDDVYGKASRAALMAYATAIEGTNRELAYDLRLWEVACRHDITEAKIMKKAGKK
jgi:hypothetical protein